MPNFYEKALFVKVDLAAAVWWERLLCALRAMLLFALSGSSLLVARCMMGSVLIRATKALRSSERSSWKGRPTSFAQSPYARDPKRYLGQQPRSSATLGRLAPGRSIFTSSWLVPAPSSLCV
jgi:hypothetical protein